MSKKRIHIPSLTGGFQEDKDLARRLRTQELLPYLEAGNDVVLDFKDVSYATQSFIHALIGEALKRYDDKVLESIEFQHCSVQLQSVIELVVDYMLGGFIINGNDGEAAST
jgi:hypothetical protein